MRLFEIAAEYKSFCELVEKEEIPDDAIRDTLESLQAPLEEKAVNIAALIRNIEAEAEAVRVAECNMVRRILTLERQAERLKDYLRNAMEVANIPRIDKSPYFVIKLQKKPHSVDVYAAEEIPEQFIKTKVITAVDKMAIRDALKAGVDVPGAKFSQENSLVIK